MKVKTNLNVKVMQHLGWWIEEESHIKSVHFWRLSKEGQLPATITLDGRFKSYTNDARDYCGDLNAAWELWADFNRVNLIEIEVIDAILHADTPSEAATNIVKIWLDWKNKELKDRVNHE